MDELIQNYKSMMSQWSDFKGRTRRKHFWQFVFAAILVSICAKIIDSIIFKSSYAGPLTGLVSLIQFVPFWAANFRRLHDAGYSAWFLLIYLLPMGIAKALPFILIPISAVFWIIGAIGLVVILYFLIKDSDADNQYGPNPKTIA